MVFFSQVYWLLQREFFLIKNSLFDIFINYAILWPCIFSVSSGYFIPLVFFPHDSINKGTELMVGMLFLQSFVVAYFMVVDLISERENVGILHYHVVATSFFAAFFSRIIFYVLYVYFCLLPFLPVAKLLLGDCLYTEQLSWPMLMLVLFFMVSLVVTYIFMLSAMVKEMRSIEHMWSYGVEPVLWLSGMWAPAYAVSKSGVPGISWLLFFNPFAYASDALRYLFFNDPKFIGVWVSLPIMGCAILLFLLLSYRILKNQVQAV